MQSTIELIRKAQTAVSSRQESKGIKAAIKALHPCLLPDDLKTRIASASRRSTNFRKLLEEVQTHLSYFDSEFNNIWAGSRHQGSRGLRYSHQRQLLRLVRIRRREAAQLLHNVYWGNYVGFDGKTASWGSRNSVHVMELLTGAEFFNRQGKLSSEQAMQFIRKVLDLASIQAGMQTRGTEARRIATPTVRSLLLDAWGASDAEKTRINGWNFNVLEDLIQGKSRRSK